MNNYTEFNSKGFLIILFLICTVFLVLIIKAFSYIPNTSSDNIVQRGSSVNRVLPPSENAAIEVNTETDSETKTLQPDSEKTDNNVVKPNKTRTSTKDSFAMEQSGMQEGLENIEDLPSEAEAANSSDSNSVQAPVEPTTDEKVMKILLDADKLKKDKQYVKAIEEYQKISTVTNDTNTIAKSYEEIATIYAIAKRYGTALSYAQKAYNLSPSSSREMLLARLYYKTGDMDKATRRINNVLQRDFSADR